ncbi:MAG: TRAP transporter small permease subunit [Gemmobacter sp.]|jgi:TRAP-type mannitol/chloroaromatic compound transport system permease small subunit|nr:TRAP transporter small permease subunit [Gemmobacter sp.]
MARFADTLLDLLCVPAKWASWLMLPLIASVLIAVAGAKLGFNRLASWGPDLPLLGRGLTMNGLLDFQWHVFAVMVLFGGILAYRKDRHVAVETVAANLPPRLRLGLLAFGDLAFLVPFCLIITWYGWSYALTAWTTGEGSTQGGLTDRWIIKAMLPLAFGLLALAGAVRGLARLATLVRGPQA